MDQLRLTWEQMVKAYRDDLFNEDTLQRLAAVFPTWRLLAELQPVSPDTVAKAVNRPVDEVRACCRFQWDLMVPCTTHR